MPGEKKSSQRFEQLEELIARVESIRDSNARASAEELIQALMDLHGAGFQRVLEVIWDSGEQGKSVIQQLGRDDLVSPLLLLYGIHPFDMTTRIETALDKVRPYLRSHGGDVQLIEVTAEGNVRLKLQGSCHGCPSSSLTMKLAVEEAIYDSAPDILELTVEGIVEPAKKLLEVRPPASVAGTNWEELPGFEAMATGAMRTVDVKGQPVLVCSIDGTYYAYSSKCPACDMSLSDARLDLTTLVCSSCDQHFDAMRAGRSLDQPALHLQPFPLLVEQGRPKIALPSSPP